MALAARLAGGTLSLGEAFSFMSGLYFRGKLGYALRFGRHATPALVITPTRGLMSPGTIVNAALLHEFAAVDVDADDQRYRKRWTGRFERWRVRCQRAHGSCYWGALPPASTSMRCRRCSAISCTSRRTSSGAAT